jgi:hypothetical protein
LIHRHRKMAMYILNKCKCTMDFSFLGEPGLFTEFPEIFREILRLWTGDSHKMSDWAKEMCHRGRFESLQILLEDPRFDKTCKEMELIKQTFAAVYFQ